MHNADYTILAINPGSTSTKVALYQNQTLLAEETIRHVAEELAALGGIPAQRQLRGGLVRHFLHRQQLPAGALSAVCGRGGILRPIPSGVYRVDDAMLADLDREEARVHASLLGALLASDIAAEEGVPAYVVDPVVVDELEDVARFSGMPGIQRGSVFHALNQKAVARRHAAGLGKPYEQCNLIVAHMGGGFTVGAHRQGRVVDLNNGVTGEGPFSPERCGALPLADVIHMCYSGAYTQKQMMDMLTRTGGVGAYLGSNNMMEAEKQAQKEPDGLAAQVLQAMAYQLAKEIGALAAVLQGQVEGILLTGGVAHCAPVVEHVRRHVGWIAPVSVYPGEDELQALAESALRVLQGREQAKVYPYG